MFQAWAAKKGTQVMSNAIAHRYESKTREQLDLENRQKFNRRLRITSVALIGIAAGGGLLTRCMPGTEESLDVVRLQAEVIKASPAYGTQPLIDLEVHNQVSLKYEKHVKPGGWGVVPGVDALADNVAVASLNASLDCNTIAQGSVSSDKLHTRFEEVDEVVDPDYPNDVKKVWKPVVRLSKDATVNFLVTKDLSKDCYDFDTGFMSSLGDAAVAQMNIIPGLDVNATEDRQTAFEDMLTAVAYHQTSDICGPPALNAIKTALIGDIRKREFDRMENGFASDEAEVDMPIDSPEDIMVELPDFTTMNMANQSDKSYNYIVDMKGFDISDEIDSSSCKVTSLEEGTE